MNITIGEAFSVHGLNVAPMINEWFKATQHDRANAESADEGLTATGTQVRSTIPEEVCVSLHLVGGQHYLAFADGEGISIHLSAGPMDVEDMEEVFYDGYAGEVVFMADYEGGNDVAIVKSPADVERDRMAAIIAEREVRGDYNKVEQTAAQFLATRQAVPGVCAALGLSPSDGCVCECETDDDIAGWTYMDGYGQLSYLVQYENGWVGAQFGSRAVHAPTLEEAEIQLVALFNLEN